MDQSSPKIGLALGGGGARGLAHIAMLEAFDELGIKPAMITGASMGAIIAAAYASGLKAQEMHDYASETLKSRTKIIKKLFSGPGGTLLKLFDLSRKTPTGMDALHLLDLFLPPGIAENFNDLEIPLIISTCDYYARKEYVFTEGALRPALAASIALPGVFTPRKLKDRIMIDGGIVNPLPFDKLTDFVDHIIAIDVTGGPTGDEDYMPNNVDLLFRSSQIMQHQIIDAKLRANPVDILIRPDVDDFRVLEFHKFEDILKASQPAKDELKRGLEALLEKSRA